jgi:hypothetical protein
VNVLELIPQPCLLDDLCLRFEGVVRIGPLTPSSRVNERLVRKSVRLQLRTHICNPRVIQALRENIPLVSDQHLNDQELAYWRRAAEIEHWHNDRTDIDVDDSILFAKYADVASQSILAALRGG